MKDQTHLLQIHHKLLLEHAHTIQENEAYNCPVKLQCYSILLQSLLSNWIKDIRYEGERIYLLENYRQYDSSMFRTVRVMRWIDNKGDIQRHTFKEALPGKMVVCDAEGKEHPFDFRNGCYFPQNDRNEINKDLFLPLPEVIRELEEKNTIISRFFSRLKKDGLSQMKRYLLDAGADIEGFTFRLFTSDEKSICLKIQVPHKGVKAHLHTNQPMINKSIMAKRSVFQEVTEATNGRFTWVYDEKKCAYSFERRFSLSQLHYMLQDQPMDELVQLINLINTTFLDDQ
jgi:hypothetical protein